MSVFVLKIIAIISMFIDHFAVIFLGGPWETDAQYLTFEAMRFVGRIAFPIFAYLIAQGCLHTKNINKYLLRLGLLALISEPFFDLAFFSHEGGINFLRNTNVFYTLFLGAAAIAVFKKVNDIFTNDEKSALLRGVLPVLSTVPMVFAANFLTTDYGAMGVILIVFIYAVGPQKQLLRAVAMFIPLYFIYPPVFIVSNNDNIARYSINQSFVFAMIAVVLVYFYNGKLGVNNTALKWGFYIFYPAHIAVLITFSHFFHGISL